MKRHQALQDLSREHHTALQLALKAKRAAVSGDRTLIETTAAACLSAYSAELDPHFVVEETVLLPLLLGAGEGALVEQGAVAEVMQNPQHAYTRQLLKAAFLVPA